MLPVLKRVDANICISPDSQMVFGYTKDGKEPAPWLLTVKSADPSVYPDNVFVTEKVMEESIRLLTDTLGYQHERKHIYDFTPDPAKPHFIRGMVGVLDYSFYLYYVEPNEPGTISPVLPWERVKRVRILNGSIMNVS